jgi:hypothetical protein
MSRKGRKDRKENLCGLCVFASRQSSVGSEPSRDRQGAVVL